MEANDISPVAVDRYVPSATVAAILGVHPKTVRRMYRDGELAGIMLGPKKLRISTQSLDAFIAASGNPQNNTSTPTTTTAPVQYQQPLDTRGDIDVPLRT
jgi:excisionase family DNA binding protein